MNEDQNSGAAATPNASPRTLGDLLCPLPDDIKNPLPMLSRTADLIAEYLHQPPEQRDQIEIHQLFEVHEFRREPGGFFEFLTKQKRFPENSIN